MTKRADNLPRPADELEDLAGYYSGHDTGGEMDHGEWVEPRPMVTTSLRLPADVIDQLKRQAQDRHVRYTTHVRSILEQAASGSAAPDLVEVVERLDHTERAVTTKERAPTKRSAKKTA